jgi:hypothetical protein
MVAGAAGFFTLAVSADAQALPLITLSGSVRGLYGSAVADSDLNPYGLGLGLRAGVTLPMSLYLGASFDYFAGESEEILGADISVGIYQLMANVGYDLGLGPIPLTLRPSLGFGYSHLNADVGDADIQIGSEDSESDFVLSPGAELILGLGLLTLSAEARYNKVFADDSDGVILGVGVGFSL